MYKLDLNIPYWYIYIHRLLCIHTHPIRISIRRSLLDLMVVCLGWAVPLQLCLLDSIVSLLALFLPVAVSQCVAIMNASEVSRFPSFWSSCATLSMARISKIVENSLKRQHLNKMWKISGICGYYLGKK